MLSPEKFHERIPRDLKENLRWRKHVLDKCRASVSYRKAVIWACSQDILFFVNFAVWQVDPTQSGDKRVGPFITWPFQERVLLDEPIDPSDPHDAGLLWAVENQRPMVWEKSREMGATWLFLITENWLCLFHKHYQALNISKSALAVDAKSKNALFPKIEFINDHLPDWLKGNVVKNKMFIGYERTQSELSGEASSARAGVGGRGGFVAVDEAAEVEELKEVREKLSSTAPFRLFVSTHLGTGNEFYNLCTDDAYIRRRMHWTQHPAKNKGLYSFDTTENRVRFWEYQEHEDRIVETQHPDPILGNYTFDKSGKPAGGPHPGIRSPWYDRKAKEIGDERAVAQQLDINPTGSVSQFYNPLSIRRLIQQHCRPAIWQGKLHYDLNTGTPLKFEKHESGLIRMWRSLMPSGKPPASKYVMGGDIASGGGCTPSCLSLGDARTGEKILEYQNAHIEPGEFGILAVALAWMFQDEDGQGAKIIWENHGPGGVFGKRVWKDLGYRNVYCKTNEHSMRQNTTDVPGWNPQKANRVEVHTLYRAALVNGLFLNPSKEALEETLNFKHDEVDGVKHTQYAVKGQDPSGARENHGDIVVADMLCYKLMMGQKIEIEAQEDEEPNIFSMAGRREYHQRLQRKAAW